MNDAIQTCMGGFCRRRDLCGHYHAASAAQEPSERLCPRGNDGAAMKESADMTRIRFSTAARVEQVAAVLTPAGVTTAQIAEALGIKTDSRMSLIMKAAVAAGAAFGTFARVSQDKQTPEMVYFPTAADRDTFRAAYEVWREQRAKERRSGTDRARYQRNRGKEIARRSAARKEARELREANRLAAEMVRKAEREQRQAQRQAKAAEKAEALAQAQQRRLEAEIRRAEAEQRKERARLNREAAAAQKQRAMAEAKKTKDRLKAETRAAGALVFKGGTDVQKVQKPRGPAFIDGPLDLTNAKVKVYETAPTRYAVVDAPRAISSNECRAWARAAAA